MSLYCFGLEWKSVFHIGDPSLFLIFLMTISFFHSKLPPLLKSYQVSTCQELPLPPQITKETTFSITSGSHPTFDTFAISETSKAP